MQICKSKKFSKQMQLLEKTNKNIHKKAMEIIESLEDANNLSELYDYIPGTKVEKLANHDNKFSIRVNRSWRIILSSTKSSFISIDTINLLEVNKHDYNKIKR